MTSVPSIVTAGIVHFNVYVDVLRRTQTEGGLGDMDHDAAELVGEK